MEELKVTYVSIETAYSHLLDKMKYIFKSYLVVGRAGQSGVVCWAILHSKKCLPMSIITIIYNANRGTSIISKIRKIVRCNTPRFDIVTRPRGCSASIGTDSCTAWDLLSSTCACWCASCMRSSTWSRRPTSILSEAMVVVLLQTSFQL